MEKTPLAFLDFEATREVHSSHPTEDYPLPKPGYGHQEGPHSFYAGGYMTTEQPSKEIDILVAEEVLGLCVHNWDSEEVGEDIFYPLFQHTCEKCSEVRQTDPSFHGFITTNCLTPSENTQEIPMRCHNNLFKMKKIRPVVCVA